MRRLRSELDAFELIRLLPPAGVVGVWAVMMADAGGFRPGTWMPAGLVLAGLLVVSAVGNRRVLPPPGPARWALLALIGFTVWCFASIAWSAAPGTTWIAADLLLVALLGAWTLALAPWRPRTADVLMGAFSLVAGVVCLVALASATGGGDLTTRFEDFRFTPPLDYPNSTAAFAFMAAIPALLQAARPDSPVVVKGLAQGLATFLCAYALLPQSRGSVLGGIAAVLVLAAVVPFRWRLALHAGLVAVMVVVASGPIGAVYEAAAETGKASAALSDALQAILLVTALGAVAGLALAVAEARVRLGGGGARAARLGGIVGCVLLVLGLGAVAVTKSSAISEELNDQWRSLKNPGVEFAGSRANAADGRLSSTDPLERYDYWRVSVGGFRAAPLGGMGAGGFEHRYAIDRRYPKPSRYPHNVVLKVLGDTGLVGVIIITGFLAAVAGGLLRRLRALAVPERVVAATALAMLAYFLAHGLFDWLEAYPVLVGPALAFGLVALAVRGRADHLGRLQGGTAPPVAPIHPPVRSPSRAVWVPAALTGVLAAGSLLAPWLGLRYRERAADTWRAAPAQAYADLRRAADVDPLSPQPLVLQGVIGLTRGDLGIARTGFEGALEREQDWLPHFGLAVIAAAAGDRSTAEDELDVAKRLHPLDPVLPEVAKKVLRSQRLDPAALVREVLASPLTTVEKVT